MGICACPLVLAGATHITPGREQRVPLASDAASTRGKDVCVCVGAGGVGKTTVSAALALGLAMRDARWWS